MKTALMGTDYVKVTEHNLSDESLLDIPKIHLMKLDFFNPTREKINKVLDTFRRTNRFIISNNVRFYNSILRGTNKKYYIENCEGDGFISFFRKNNKCLLNVINLLPKEKQFLLDVCIIDVLRNIEVIMIEQEDLDRHIDIFEPWSGNCIIYDEEYQV